MLADIIVGRSSYGGERGRHDIHLHATAHYGFRRFFKRFALAFGMMGRGRKAACRVNPRPAKGSNAARAASSPSKAMPSHVRWSYRRGSRQAAALFR